MLPVPTAEDLCLCGPSRRDLQPVAGRSIQAANGQDKASVRLGSRLVVALVFVEGIAAVRQVGFDPLEQFGESLLLLLVEASQCELLGLAHRLLDGLDRVPPLSVRKMLACLASVSEARFSRKPCP